MKIICSVALVVFAITASPSAVAQDLDINQLQAGQPTAFSGIQPRAAGEPTFGYQFRYGSFAVEGGSPPTAQGIFALTTQQFPQGSVQKLYNESLTYRGFNPGGPLEGAVFECSVNGNRRYFLFGTVSQGVQDEIELRQIRYFDENGVHKYTTLARFYAP